MPSNNEEPAKINLEYYSERFAKKLFKKFPQWKRYADHYTVGEPDDISYYLEVQIPPENPNVTEPLRIQTYPQEVLVSWLGGTHYHFDSWPEHKDTLYMESAIQSLEAIITDQIVFYNIKKDGKPVAGGSYNPLTSELPPNVLSLELGSVILRSWLSGHDREMHA